MPTTVRAYHHVIDDGDAATWIVAGQYVMTLNHVGDRWVISGITLQLWYEEGDRELVDIARERVATGRGGRAQGAVSTGGTA